MTMPSQTRTPRRSAEKWAVLLRACQFGGTTIRRMAELAALYSRAESLESGRPRQPPTIVLS